MPIEVGHDSSNTRRTMDVDGTTYAYYSLAAADEAGLGDFSNLPKSFKVLIENLLRFEDGNTTTVEDIKAFATWAQNGGKVDHEIGYRPARVLMQDFTGVPAVVDLAAMRDGIEALGGDAKKINPMNPVDLVIDHSVMIDEFGNPRAFQHNVEREYERNIERYTFLKWGQKAFQNFRVVPPGTGICHQVNLEYLGRAVWNDEDQNGELVAYPDTLVGTDSHTTMINGLGVLGWGVGGIEAEAAMLGQPVSMLIPEVVGFKLTGAMPEGTTATDLVLRVCEMLREKGVVQKFVEFYGDGLDNVPLADRATIGNMSPEFGGTCAFFPIDGETLRYLGQTGRGEDTIKLVEAYAKEQGLWRKTGDEPTFTDTLELDMATVKPAISGPKHPQQHINLDEAAAKFHAYISNQRKSPKPEAERREKRWEAEGGQPAPEKIPGDTGRHKRARVTMEDIDGEEKEFELHDGSIVIASITSCTNTSNPSVMIGAGLIARKARELGLNRKPWVKTSLAPGSQVVSSYLNATGLQEDLDAIGFNLVGYGCTTCIGNSGPIPEALSKAISENDLIAVSVLSGNRNFEGRISPDVRANYLASPPLVVAYALVGDMNVDIAAEPLGQDKDGNDVYLKDLWPSQTEIARLVEETVTSDRFKEKYADVFEGDERWREIETTDDKTYDWPSGSTYVQEPPFFKDMDKSPGKISNIENARMLALLGDMVTTDHISPAGSFKETSPAGNYLTERQVQPREFNSYGSRRGNHEVMMRGTFANIRIRNEMLDGVEGGYTKGPDGEEMPIYDAAMKYIEQGTPLVVIAGQQYGAGSSRDWAAKGTALLGVKAVIAESYERIHRSNLVGMGVLPFEFTGGDGRESLELTGDETFSIHGLEEDFGPGATVPCTITYPDGSTKEIEIRSRIDTAIEIDYVKNGGVLHYVLRRLADTAEAA